VLTVALTGGIACGKSVVAGILRDKGCYVHDADRTAHELMAPGGAAYRPVVERFGKGILADGGPIDRKKLGAVVFADAAARAALDAIVHPLVLQTTRRLVADVEASGRYALFVTEAALTVEAGFVSYYDRVVVVICDEETRVQRLMARDGIGRDEALRKIGAQMTQTEKAGRANYVIDTSGTLAETVEQTERVHAMLVQDEGLKDRPRSMTRAGRVPGKAGSA
jgi:dephospho-CoA kinase